MNNYPTYNGHMQHVQPAQSPLQHEEFAFQPPFLHPFHEERISTLSHEYLTSQSMVYAPTPLSQVPLTNHDVASQQMHIYFQEGLHDPQLYSPGLHSPHLHSPHPISPVPASSDAEDWHSQTSTTRTHSATPLDHMSGHHHDAGHPSFSTSQVFWTDHTCSVTAQLASPPLSQRSSSFLASTQIEQPDKFATTQISEYLSDMDADGEDEDEMPSIGQTADLVAPTSPHPSNPLTPNSDADRMPLSSGDEVMSDDDSEYKPRSSSHKVTKRRRRLGTAGRSARKSQKLSIQYLVGTKPSGRTTTDRISTNRTVTSNRRAGVTNSRITPYYCPFAPFGCMSQFPNKNEWKRHARTQHLQEYFWRCNLCHEPPGVYNDFNRKDLYEQHVQRMHREVLQLDFSDISASVKRQLEANKLEKETRKEFQKGKDRLKKDYWLRKSLMHGYEQKCRIRQRDLPTSCICPISTCSNKTFQGTMAWDDRMEHMSGHFEKSRRPSGGNDANKYKPAYWLDDAELINYLEEKGLIVQADDGSWKLPKPASR